jgi:outer membrane protein assembly factor BamB
MTIRCVAILLMAFVPSVCSVAQDASPKGEHEPFPQSAKLARDRRAELVLETARAQLRQQDYASAVVALQELLDGPNAFGRGDATVTSVAEEALRILREMPAPAREAYERRYGAEANRLWQAARQSDRPEALREVVARFGATKAGWFALRDLAGRSLDRGEWRLAAAISAALARHPYSADANETSWIADWILAESRSATNPPASHELWQRYRTRLERLPAPATSDHKNLSEWLEKQLPPIAPASSTVATDERTVLGLAPTGHNVWQRAAGTDGVWLEEILHEWGHYDVLALPSVQPLVLGDVVIARFVHPAKVVAVDARRGKLLWEQSFAKEPLAPTFTDLERHPGIRSSLMDELQRRWFGDSVRGRMTSDGRRLFLVNDLDDLDLKPGAGSRLRNHLEAWDLATGERRWRIGSSTNEPPTGFEGVYFLGPPLVSDRSLYVVAQRESQVALWVLRASDGQLEWTLPLAETDRQQFKELGWRHVACPVTWAGGRLICPTGAGCFVAVDPVTRSLAWSVRFERDDINTATGILAADRDRPFPVRWWESWREVESRELRVERPDKSVQQLLLLASPESRSLRMVDSQTGELVWRVKFAEPLFVASHPSAVLVFERQGMTALDLANGRERWHVSHSAPAGPSEWIGDHYAYPLLDGGWSMIAAASGAIHKSDDEFRWDVDLKKEAATKKLVSFSTGRLVRAGGKWAVLTPSHLGLFESAANRPSDIAKQPPSKLDEIESTQRRGDRLTGLRDTLDWLDQQPVGERTISEPTPTDTATRTDVPRSASTRTVRLDRWAQGVILDLFATADAETRQKMETVLAERRQRAIDSPDPFALQTLADKLASLPMGRDLRLQLSGRSGVGVGYLPTSLALREIAQGNDRLAAAQAWYRLALLHDFRSEPQQAADCYRELRDRFSDVKLADGRSSAEWLTEVMPDSLIGRALSEGPRDPWPNRLPKITTQDEPHDDIYFYPIPFQTRDPSWRRMTVSVERQGRKVRFHGAEQRGFWDLPLPKSNSPRRHNWDMYHGWGLGPLLVLQVGDDLFGIQPLDERGETNAKLLWTITVGPYEEVAAHQFLPGRLGIRPDDFVLLDRYEQPVLNVVHASPGLVCYRSRNRLIAIDPATGSRLWMRHHLPPLASITGDGEHVVLRLIATRELEVRRGFDGQLLSRRDDTLAPNSIVTEFGTQRLLLDAQKPNDASSVLRLRLQDLISGTIRWERMLPPRSVPLMVDDSRCGIVEPTGTLRFLSLNDGHDLAKQEVPLPMSLATAQVFSDDLRLFVILAGPVTEPSWLVTQQDRGGFRKPLLNGWLHAFDRRTLRLLWTIPTKNLPLAIDQPQDAPFLLLTYKRPSDDSADGQASDGVLHLIDKRTGQEVMYEAGPAQNVYVTLEPDPLQQRIDLLTPKRRLRLDYAAE